MGGAAAGYGVESNVGLALDMVSSQDPIQSTAGVATGEPLSASQGAHPEGQPEEESGTLYGMSRGHLLLLHILHMLPPRSSSNAMPPPSGFMTSSL